MSVDILNIAEAEKLAGRRLDRRRKYFFIDGHVCTYGSWTESCTGCFEHGEYGGGSPITTVSTRNVDAISALAVKSADIHVSALKGGLSLYLSAARFFQKVADISKERKRLHLQRSRRHERLDDNV